MNLMEKYKKFIPYIIGLILVGYMIISNVINTRETEQNFDIPIPIENSGVIIVEIKGEIKRPGIYKIHETTRLFEVIVLAGGFTKEADFETLNLAQVVSDGMSIHIHAKQTVDTPQEVHKISINDASLQMLMQLKGIGEARAKSIIEFRLKNGPFHRIEDLMKVSGISEAIYHQIKDDIRI